MEAMATVAKARMAAMMRMLGLYEKERWRSLPPPEDGTSGDFMGGGGNIWNELVCIYLLLLALCFLIYTYTYI